MSHLQTPHKSFARYASVLRENLIACDTSLRKGEEDWHATLGRLNAAFVRYIVLICNVSPNTLSLILI